MPRALQSPLASNFIGDSVTVLVDDQVSYITIAPSTELVVALNVQLSLPSY
jgi:hypothetical protein